MPRIDKTNRLVQINFIETLYIVVLDVCEDGREVGRDLGVCVVHIATYYVPLHFVIGASFEASVATAATVAGARVFGHTDTNYLHRTRTHVRTLIGYRIRDCIRKILRL
jgi:hypothetical protein